MANWIVLLLVLTLLTIGGLFYRDSLPMVRSISAQPVPGVPGVRLSVLPGDEPGLTLEDVIRRDRAGDFVPVETPDALRVYNTKRDAERWFRIRFENPGPEVCQSVLDLIWRVYDVVDFYELQDDGTFQRRRSGGSVPYWDPERTARHCAFDVTLEPGKTLTTYLRVKDCFRLPSQFSFWPNADPFVRWERFIASTNLAYACLWGGMTAFGIFLYALLRERAQRHYVIFLLAIGGVHFISTRMILRFITWPEWPLAEICISVLAAIALTQLIAFTRTLLDTAEGAPRADAWLRKLNFGWLGMVGLFPVIFWAPAGPHYYQAFMIMVVVTIASILWVSLVRYRAGRKLAAFIILAFLPYLIGLTILTFHVYDGLARKDEYRVLTLVGNALSLIFLSFAAAYRYRVALQEKAGLQERYTLSLEREVQERTRTLQELSDQLTLSLAERNRVMAIIGHDLRGPAASLQGLAQLLADEGPLFSREQLASLAREINDACDLQLELLNNLLTWGSLHGEGGEIEREPIAVPKAVDDVWRLLQKVAAGKGITFHNDVRPDLSVRSDRQLFETILRNLLANAVKFTHAGGWARASGQLLSNGAVEVTIEDNGVGIPPERLATLFSGRGQSTLGTRSEKGSGIGLNLARDLARTAGGDLRVESEVGRGTTVFVVLP